MTYDIFDISERVIADASGRLNLSLCSMADEQGQVHIQGIRLRVGPSAIVTPDMLHDLRDESALCSTMAERLRDAPCTRRMNVIERTLYPDGTTRIGRTFVLVRLDAIGFDPDNRSRGVRYRPKGRLERTSDGQCVSWDIHGAITSLPSHELGNALFALAGRITGEPTTPAGLAPSLWGDTIIHLEACLRLPDHRDRRHP